MPAPPIPVALTGGVNVPLRNGIAGNDNRKGFARAADAPAGVETTESILLLLELMGLLGGGLTVAVAICESPASFCSNWTFAVL